MDARLESQMKAMEAIQGMLQDQLLRFVQEERVSLEERRKSMDMRNHIFQNQPAPTSLKNKILKSQVGIVSHKHNHRPSITDFLSSAHQSCIEDDGQHEPRVSPLPSQRSGAPSKQNFLAPIGGYQSVKAENEELDSDESNDCNVADDEEEAIENIKAQNAD